MADISPEGTVDLRADSRRNRVRLVAAARELVAEKGLEVTAAEIAARAEVGVGTLYRRFGSKEALISDILIDGIDEVQAIAEQAAVDPDPWNGLSTFFEFFSRTQFDNQGIADFTASATGHPGQDACEPTGRLATLIQEIVRRAHLSGTLRSDVTWQDIVILSRASVSAGECLGVKASPDQWHRTCAVILAGLRSTTTAPLP
ncbi:MAG: TetR/AcrR family transcriptional regulator [Aeromicrobium sp.]